MHDLALIVGSKFQERYKILSLLGSGGTALVYHAVDEWLKRPVAIKILHKHLLDEENKARLVRECKIISLLKHPCFAQVYQYAIAGEQTPFVVMEYVEGGGLRQWLNNNETMNCADALRMCLKLCEGLRYAHDRGIIHRDLNPNNVLLGDGNPQEPKIVDFGLSLLNRQNRAVTFITEPGSLIGTPHYLSPEQCVGKLVDGRSDIYSLGCTLYECITGEKVFDADTTVGLVYKHLNERPVLPSSRVTVLPGVDDLLSRALAKEPCDRYQTAFEFARDIHLILSGKGTSVSRTKSINRTQKLPAIPGQTLWYSTSIACVIVAILAFSCSDPGPIRLLIKQTAMVPAFDRARILNAIAGGCGLIGKPLAKLEAYQQIIDSPATLRATPRYMALQSLEECSHQLYVLKNVDTARILTSDLIAQYLKYLFQELEGASNGNGKVSNQAQFSDATLAHHLQNILDLVGYSGHFTSESQSELRQLFYRVGSDKNLRISQILAAELALYLNKCDENLQTHGEALYSLARAYNNEKEYSLAHAYYNQCMAISKGTLVFENKKRIKIEQDLWALNMRLGLPLQMLQTSKPVISDNFDANSLVIYGCWLCSYGNYNAAIIALESAKRQKSQPIDPRLLTELRWYLARAYLCSGQVTRATKLFEGARLSIEDAALMCVIDLKSGRVESGRKKLIQWMQNARRHLPAQRFELHNNMMARTLLTTGLQSDCEDFCNRMLSQPNTTTGDILLQLAQIRNNSGRYSEAEQLCQRALTLPLNEYTVLELSTLMAELMVRSGDNVRARHYATKALLLALVRDDTDTALVNSLRRTANTREVFSMRGKK